MARKTTINISPVINKVKKATTTQVLYVAVLILVFAVGYLFAKVQVYESGLAGTGSLLGTAQQGDTAQQAQAGDAALTPAAPFIVDDLDPGDLPPLGDESAPVKIVEFSDFQCPYCRAFYEDTFAKLKTDYIDTGKAVLYYRHYPLSFHPQSQISAEASECANDQGKFWEMHDKMYEEQAKEGQGTIEYTSDDLKKWAGEIGVDQGQFDSCLDSGKYTEKVKSDLADGTTAGVDGTPSFFVNGERLVGAQPFEAFKTLIDSKL